MATVKMNKRTKLEKIVVLLQTTTDKKYKQVYLFFCALGGLCFSAFKT